MNKLSFIPMIAILLLSSCASKKNISQQKNSDVILEIHTRNLHRNQAFLQDVKGKTYPLTYRENGMFLDTLHLPEGFYKATIGREYTNMYLRPGDRLKVNLDANQFDESITYEGVGSKNNQVLANEILIDEKLRTLYKNLKSHSISEKKILHIQDSIQQLYKQNLNRYNITDTNFIKLENRKFSIKNGQTLLEYAFYFKQTQPNQKLSDNFYDFTKSIDINDPSWMKIPGFTDYVIAYLNNDLIQNLHPYPGFDYMYELLKKADEKLNGNPDLKQQVALSLAKQGIDQTGKIKEFYTLFDRMVKNPELKKPIKEVYDQLSKLQPGSPSPDFTAYDINGKEYHLKDFAGKLLYIDLWATWCAPCRAEIPYLEKLKKEYAGKNINFVSLDVYDKKDAWERMMKTGKLTGNQLISTDTKMSFLKEYVVKGIPRFILLDEQGKIISQNAPRPSNPVIKRLIDQHLK